MTTKNLILNANAAAGWDQTIYAFLAEKQRNKAGYQDRQRRLTTSKFLCCYSPTSALIYLDVELDPVVGFLYDTPRLTIPVAV